MLRTNKTQGAGKMALSLPTEKKGLPTDISQYKLFVYGSQKIGKTSFTAQFPNALHFFFEPSGTDYELFCVEPQNWEQFVGYIELLEEKKVAGTLEFKTFIIDVVDLAYEACLKFVCGKQGLDYPPMNDFGQTWSAIKKEFREVMIRLARLGGIVCVSHAKDKDIETRKGSKYTVTAPTASNGCVEVLSKWCDLTALYRSSGDDSRELCITPSSEYEAGNRMESRFKHPDGSQIERIPMGASSKEAFANFMKAFRNELPKQDAPAKEAKKIPVPVKTGGVKLGRNNNS